MKKVKEVRLTPEVFGPVEAKEGCEQIYQIAKAAIIVYEDGSVRKGDRVMTEYYREVDESRANEEGIKKFSFCSPDDFIVQTKFLESIKTVEALADFNAKFPSKE